MRDINQEEYEVLKPYISEEKYIAKDRDGSIRLLTDYPERDMKRGEWSDGWGKSTLKNSANNFQFIKWEDDEPYNIAELIEDYESEETEVKKNIEWVISEINQRVENVEEHEKTTAYNKGVARGLGISLFLINQLDEPEVLSQEWIDERSYNIEEYWQVADMMDGPQYAVSVENLQNLLVPKQDEVDRAYKDGYEKGKQHTFYKGYLEGLSDKENELETVADVVTTFWKSFERLKEVMSMEVKELEELGEVAQAYTRNQREELKVELGDLLVTVIIFAQQNNINLEEALRKAYNKINGRNGKMVDGLFIKEEDLDEI